MRALLFFFAAGTVNWIAGWAMVIATAVVVISRHPELLAEHVGPRKGAKTCDTILLSLYGVAMMIMRLHLSKITTPHRARAVRRVLAGYFLTSGK